MVKSKWKKINVDKWRTLFVVGRFVVGKGYRDWIHVDKTSLVGEWEVGAKRIINPKTKNGHFKYFKSKPASIAKGKAMAFAKAYMKKN